MFVNPMAKAVSATTIRLMYNVGCLFDISTGTYVKGMKGESILNGGVSAIEGFTGPGNSFKTTLALFRMLMVLHRYNEATGSFYDTETSAQLTRMMKIADIIDPSGKLSASLAPEVGRFIFTDAADYNGSQWFDMWKEGVAERAKQLKPLPSPVFDPRASKPLAVLPPFVTMVDSFSMFQTNAVFKKMDDGTVGESEMNSVAMQNQNGKSQVMDSLPYLTSKGGASITLTAHMGDTIVMDQYNAPKKKLSFVKNTRKMKKVPESFTFLTNNLFEIVETSTLLNRESKLPEFPRNPDDDLKGTTDLMEITVLPIRVKSGITGYPFKIIVSQSEGVQTSLTEYWYLKTYNRFGLSANTKQQRLAFYPGVVFTRNNIRQIIASDPKFRRALEFLSELCQMVVLWPAYQQEPINPDDIYEKIKAQGYDWDEILSTRGYWTFDQYTNPTPFLSTKDLFDMYKGEYTPYWKK